MKPLLENPADIFNARRISSLDWRMQRRQYAARYVFALVFFGYFCLAEDFPPVLFDAYTFFGLFWLYLLIIVGMMTYVRWKQESMLCIYLTMWLDFAAMSMGIIHDPNPALPTMLLLLPILLGNGLRYGDRLLWQAILGSMLAVPVILTLRIGVGGIAPELSTFLVLFVYMAVIFYSAYLVYQSNRLRRWLRDLSPRDRITGLLNRRALFEEGEIVFNMLSRTGLPLTLMLLDIPDLRERGVFKEAQINQSLREVANSLRYTLRNYDVASRYENDQFLVLFPNTDLRQVRPVIDRLVATAQERLMQVTGRQVTLRIALGQAPEDATDFSALLSRVEVTFNKIVPSSQETAIELVNPRGDRYRHPLSAASWEGNGS